MKCAAVEALPRGVSLIAVVAGVQMRVRGMGRIARHGRVDAVIAIVRTMKSPGRPRDLERQHGQQEQQYETFHGGGV